MFRWRFHKIGHKIQSMYNYKKSLNFEPRSSSKRWETTTGSALNETAIAIRKLNREEILDDMRTRKIANTKSSISFGQEPIDYVSDMKDNQRRCQIVIDPVERDLQQHKNKTMKANLTKTSFTLGDDTPDYESVNHKAMAEGEKFYGYNKIGMFTELKEAIKRSSIKFGPEGAEPVNYRTVNQESMEYKGSEMNFPKIKEEISAMKANLRKHNFNLGTDSVDYTSDYQRGYGSLGTEHYRAAGQYRDQMKAIKADLRATHWSFGQEKVKYLSDTQEALKAAEGNTRADEVAKNMARAKQMKADLVKTSYVIGDDEKYN